MDIETIISTWRLDGVSNKRMLFIECPFVSHNGNLLIFEHMGFDIERHQFWCQELDKLLNDVKNNYQVLNFDVILICISEKKFPEKEIVISKAFLSKFRDIIQEVETGKLSRIPVVGMNLNLSGKTQAEQVKIFDGLFIGGDTTDEQIREMFRNLIDTRS